MRVIEQYSRNRVSRVEATGEIAEQFTRHYVRVVDDLGVVRKLAFDHAPTDAEILSALPAGPVEIDPGPGNGRRAIFEAAAAAARDWDALDRLNAKVLDPATGATNKQKAGALALSERAYTRARRLASDYADAIAE